MPIYEYYCAGCHLLLSFFTASSGTRKKPACPHCGRRDLPKRPSTFAMVSRSPDETAGADDPIAGLDEARLEGAMEKVLGEADGLDDEDPRQMARLFRDFSAAAGIEPGPKMEEMLARLDAGADPDELDAAMGDDEDLAAFFRVKQAAAGVRAKRPGVDKELYFL